MKTQQAKFSVAQPVAAVDLERQIATADLIVAATVIQVVDSNRSASRVGKNADPAKDRVREAKVDVLREFLGSGAGDRLRVLFLAGKVPGRPWVELQKGQTLILFLKRIGSEYVSTNPTAPPIGTLPRLASPAAGADAVTRIARELEQIILKANSRSTSSIVVSAVMARIGLRRDLDLRLLDTPALKNPIRRAAWIAVALAEGKSEVLNEVLPLFNRPPAPPAEVLWSLVAQKVSEIKASEARTTLTALLSSGNAALDRSAAVALRQLHEPAAIPDLIVALDHPHQDVRYQAVMGLAELEPGVDAGPSLDRYRKDEAIYIKRWKEWWTPLRRR